METLLKLAALALILYLAYCLITFVLGAFDASACGIFEACIH